MYPTIVKADMHFHSRYSDGALWPAQLAALALAAGLQAAALTDHDTLAGSAEFCAAAAELGLVAWPAVEIDCVDEPSGYRSELLAYFPGGSYERTAALLVGVRAERRRIVAGLFDRAARLMGASGLSFERYEERELASRPGFAPPIAVGELRYGKPDLHRALVQERLLDTSVSYKEFKKAYLKTGLLGPAKFPKPSVEELCRVVAADGGHCSIPHPAHFMDDDPSRIKAEGLKLRAMLERLKGLGVGYLELYAYPKKADSLNKLMWKEAQALGYGLTYGSDDHGPGSGTAAIGSFHGDFIGFPAAAGAGKA